MAKSTREQAIKSCVNNLKEFGYPHVTEENVLTDPIYSAFFQRQLTDAIDELNEALTSNSRRASKTRLAEAIQELTDLFKITEENKLK